MRRFSAVLSDRIVVVLMRRLSQRACTEDGEVHCDVDKNDVEEEACNSAPRSFARGGDDDDQVKPWRRWETALRLSRQVKSRDGCRVSIGRSGQASSHDRPHVLTFVSLPRR